MHPLVHNLDTLKDGEIESRIQSLSKKYFATQNPDLRQQIVMVLDDYKTELAARQRRQLQAEYQKRDKDLDNLIKVD